MKLKIVISDSILHDGFIEDWIVKAQHEHLRNKFINFVSKDVSCANGDMEIYLDLSEDSQTLQDFNDKSFGGNCLWVFMDSKTNNQKLKMLYPEYESRVFLLNDTMDGLWRINEMYSIKQPTIVKKTVLELDLSSGNYTYISPYIWVRMAHNLKVILT